MDQTVSLKGVGDGLRLHIGVPMARKELLAEISPLFDRIRQLASGARITVDASGEDPDLLPFLRDFLIREYEVAEVIPMEAEQPRRQEVRKRQRDVDRSWENRKSDVLMMCGRVRSGQKIQAKGHLVLMGDVNPGGEVIAGGDIIVLGSLCGMAMAGQTQKKDAIIMALDFRPTLLHIGQQVSSGPFGAGNRSPEYAFLREDRIEVADYLGNPPFGRLPWPEFRP
ncbi:septum site-determining protein MinC [Desulfobotulus alkaliphilus]|uniref:Probable septum site-determining protein MinC n=1 Tax=Desulfobotulus alkaliphilus TaxID=622671 RepID=A0A562RHF6_9BACT|nr:septum site-determining protein MinC [Desulfobotulus alkaliphilus]TWI67806.1 septum site-determining protein MinC [Desulfobotulus alkaliphilus]